MTQPWESEADWEAFRRYDFQCVIKRNGYTKTWCGYLCVPRDHPWYGHTNTIESPLIDVDVHGGVTFAGCNDALGLAPHPWVIGFDCNHAFDFAPGMAELFTDRGHPIPTPGSVYRNIFYAKDQCERMAAQAEAVWVNRYSTAEKPPYWQTFREFYAEGGMPAAVREASAQRSPLDRSDEELALALVRARGGRVEPPAPHPPGEPEAAIAAIPLAEGAVLDRIAVRTAFCRLPKEPDSDFRRRILAALKGRP